MLYCLYIYIFTLTYVVLFVFLQTSWTGGTPIPPTVRASRQDKLPCTRSHRVWTRRTLCVNACVAMWTQNRSCSLVDVRTHRMLHMNVKRHLNANVTVCESIILMWTHTRYCVSERISGCVWAHKALCERIILCVWTHVSGLLSCVLEIYCPL